MSESIAKEMYKRYKVSIIPKGVWFDGEIKNTSFGYKLVVFGVTLNSSKSYKRYTGAERAAKKLIKELDKQA